MGFLKHPLVLLVIGFAVGYWFYYYKEVNTPATA